MIADIKRNNQNAWFIDWKELSKVTVHEFGMLYLVCALTLTDKKAGK